MADLFDLTLEELQQNVEALLLQRQYCLQWCQVDLFRVGRVVGTGGFVKEFFGLDEREVLFTLYGWLRVSDHQVHPVWVPKSNQPYKRPALDVSEDMPEDLDVSEIMKIVEGV